MGAALYWLSDAEWAKIERLMPRGRCGAHRVDDRRVISGIIHMLRSGGRWRDCPMAYGPYTASTDGAGRGFGSRSSKPLPDRRGFSERSRSTARQSKPIVRRPAEKGGIWR